MKKSQWGKKAKPYKPVDIDEPIDVKIYPMNIPAPAQSKSAEEKKEALDKANRAKTKRVRRKEDKQWVLMIPEYMKFLHDEYGAGVGKQMEVHHWMPKSRIKHNDFFVCCLSPDEHRHIHHGNSSVNAFIEGTGEEVLLKKSIETFEAWLATDAGLTHRNHAHFVEMVDDIRKNPTSFYHVLRATRGCSDRIRFSKNGR